MNRGLFSFWARIVIHDDISVTFNVSTKNNQWSHSAARNSGVRATKRRIAFRYVFCVLWVGV
ncbi:hypothetical protein QWZ16_00385 [Vibrio ostreicida]|uniref:DUF3265 domain-containing protein n=1 Tax=Vibrio ostreicida TaxID=526588 RepID=A0ABT8BQ60_9VIBR|nr:hypothetical protein [Vibrio ostreicida]MDN3608243.1 hypothetical protein [Vibrio ostreicida]